jgi:pyrroloquinoline quinone biosynthesis protein E
MKLSDLLAHGASVAKAHALGARIPLNVMLGVTNRCLSHCAYCQIPTRSHAEMTTEQIKELLRQMAAAGTIRVGLWGGEPLIRPDIGEIVTHARSLGMYTTMDSNGYLVPRRIEALRDLDHLVLGFDGPEEAHDANREPGSHAKVMAAMEATRGRVPFWTLTVMTRNNLRHLQHILDVVHGYDSMAGFQVLHHNPFMGGDTSKMLPTDEEYRRAISWLLEEKRRGAPIACSRRYLAYLLAWPSYRVPKTAKLGGLRCWAGRLFCNVDVDGSVYPCSLLIDEMPALNALQVGFKRAFDATKDYDCRACDAACYTEYNYLYSLDISTVIDWISAMRNVGGARHAASPRERRAT